MEINKLFQLIKGNARADGSGGIRSESTDTEAHVYIYDVIDSYWGASASQLLTELAAAGDKVVHLHINSPGGDVFEARAMVAAIVAHKGEVIAHIDGMAASAATYLALSANEVRMTDGGMFMIHNSWTFAMGDRTQLRSTADLLEKIDGTINADYQRKTGKTSEQITSWMNAETWFTAAEAKENGFVDAIEASSKSAKASAKWDLSAYANAPVIEDSEQEPEFNQNIAAQLQANRNRMRMMAQAQI